MFLPKHLLEIPLTDEEIPQEDTVNGAQYNKKPKARKKEDERKREK